MATSPPLQFALNLAQAQVSKLANSHGLTTIQSDGLHIESGGSLFGSLSATNFDEVQAIDAINQLNLAPEQTLTLAELKGISLVAGEQLVIDYSYLPGDIHYDDFGVSIMRDEAGGAYSASLLGSVQHYLDTGLTHFVATITASVTGVFDLLLGSADVGDPSEPSSLNIHSVSVQVPASDYTLTTGGVLLSDGTTYRPDGSALLPGGAVEPGLLSGGAGNQVSALETGVAAGLIGPDGSGLFSANGGGVIGENSSGLFSLNGNGIISQDGNGIISQDGNTIISQDGNGIISQDGNTLISQDGNGVISNDGGSVIGENSSGLIGENSSGLIAQNASSLISLNGGGIVGGNELHVLSLDEQGLLPRQFAAATPPAPPAGTGVPDAEFAVSAGPVWQIDKAQNQVAALSDGKFAVAWTDYNTHTDTVTAVEVQLMNADGSMAGPGFAVPATSVETVLRDTVAVVALSGGGYALTYAEYDEAFTPPYAVTPHLYVQIFDASGTAVGGPSDVGPPIPLLSQISATALSDGSFMILESENTGADQTIARAAQRVSASGVAQGPLITISSGNNAGYVTYDAGAAVALPNGAVGVAYTDATSDQVNPFGLYFVVIDASGTAGTPVLIKAGDGAYTSMAVLTDGNLVVAWLHVGGDSFHAQVITPAGVLVGSEIVGEYIDPNGAYANPLPPAITALSDGRFMIAYALPNPAAPMLSTVIDAQIYNADGTPSGAIIAGSTPDSQISASSPVATQLTDGTVEIVSARQGGFGQGGWLTAEPITLAGETAPATAAATAQGRAVDGYISGATVFADANGDGLLSPGEASATTDSLGRYSFTTPASGTVILTGGTDTSTGLPFSQTLTAPAGALTVTPLTTLVQKIAAANGGNLVLAERQVNAEFGLAADTDVTALDPVRSSAAGSSNGAATFVAGAIVADVVALATAAGATGDPYGALAAQVEANPVSFDPTSVAAMLALGLAGTVATDTAALAQASAALLKQTETADAANAPALLLTGAAIEKVAQGATSTAWTAAVGAQNDGPVLTAYTGAALASAVAAAESACFASGTRIATARGSVRVEKLAVGDLVITKAGARQKIRWIGHRAIDCNRHPRPWDVWPVHI